MSSVLQSLRIACSFTAFPSVGIKRSQLPAVSIQRTVLPQCNRLLVLCEFENFAVSHVQNATRRTGVIE